jgi:hypothetical protein
VLLGWQNVGFQNVFALCTEADSTSGMFHPAMVREMDHSINLPKRQQQTAVPWKTHQKHLEEKEGETVVEDEDKRDNALKESISQFSAP